jgi:glucose-1-phosphate adenylyltransferase
MHPDVLTMVLAGGEGRRLRPLTDDRAKPAVPFGGRYRIIDFVLSNLVNSGFYHINVLTQYKSDSLSRHISAGWHLSSVLDQFINIIPAQQRVGEHWYKGSADAVFQNLNLIEDHDPHDVCVFGGDNIYKMHIGQMLELHRDNDAELTVATIPVPIAQAREFGVIQVDERGRILGFEEKPANPKPLPHDPTRALVSMGNYIFRRDVLVREVTRDAKTPGSAHDFGKNIITDMVRDPSRLVFAYDFSVNRVPGQPDSERGYWRDVGSVDSYWQTSMDLVAVVPEFDLYNRRWPIRTFYDHFPPAKFVHDDHINGRTGMAVNSLVAEGCIVSGGTIRHSVLFPQVRINSYASIEESILFERVQIGRRARIRRAIIDKNVEVPPDAVIGYDLEHDRERFEVSEGGIVVVKKGTKI